MNFSSIHKFTFDQDIVLLDVESGSVHLIDEPLSLLLDKTEETGSLADAVIALSGCYSHEILSSAASELDDLVEQGLLFSAPALGADKLPPTWLKSICLNISHDCNLRCRYCFAGTGNFGGERLNMTFEVARAAIDYLLAESGPRPFCEVDFFGGEPLMNLEVVQKTVAYGKAAARKLNKKIKFTLTTNAIALTDEVIDWLNQEELSVVLSHDGRSQVHDYMRMLPNGGGSHLAVNERIKALVKTRPSGNYYIRGTYTANNLDFSHDVKYWLSEGYRELSIEPVVTAPNVKWALKEDHLPQLREEYHELARFYNRCCEQGESFNFFHFNLDLEHGPCLPKRLWGCGAGYEYLAVTPDGELYPCHQFVGRKGFIIGNVREGIKNPDLSERFKKAHIEAKDSCRSCWAKYYCSGGCHANADATNGDIYQPYFLGCRLQKIRLECAIWLAVQKLLRQQL